MTQSNDIAHELGLWLDEASARQRKGEKPGIDVDLVRWLRGRDQRPTRDPQGSRRTTRSIGTEDLNASNDE